MAATSRCATPDGADLGATEAAHALLLSGASLLSAEYADAFVCAALARAGDIEAAACLAGDSPAIIAAKVTAVLVSAAVRASVIARGPDVSPSAINRATLSWYELSHMRRRELLDAGANAGDLRLQPRFWGELTALPSPAGCDRDRSSVDLLAVLARACARE